MKSPIRYVMISLIIGLCAGLLGCPAEPLQKPVEKEGLLYGVTRGTFRHRWWNYYERGNSFADGGFWKEAEADLRQAISLWDGDRRRERTYGMHFIDYFPRRELGVVLLRQGRIDAAISELEDSLSKEVSAKGQYYLDKARGEKIRREKSDNAPPQITLAAPLEQQRSNGKTYTVQGEVSDDTFVKEIRVNGKPVRIDLAQKQIPFSVEIPLQLGPNSVEIEAVDLAGKRSRMERTLICDRSGPIVNLDGLDPENGLYRLFGYAYDAAGIRSITVNDREILKGTAPETKIDHRISLSGQKGAVVIAEDRVGNITRAVISPNASTKFMEMKEDTLQGPLLAAVGNPFLFFRGTQYLSYRGNPLRGLPTSERRLNRLIWNYKNLGNDYALIIGINNYEHWPPLQTAANDAKGLYQILSERYGYLPGNIRLRTNEAATQAALIQDLREIAAGLGENDNLLIYFAGHGQMDDLTSDGYWIPADGKLQEPTSWITHSSIKAVLSSEKVRAKSVMIIADSCYSGSLLRGGPSSLSPQDLDYQARLMELARKKSRQIITSGGLEPVMDQGRDGHSLFAYYLLKALEENELNVIDFESLLMNHVWTPVAEIGGQRPTLGRLKTPMDENGQFVLVLDSGEEETVSKDTEEPEVADENVFEEKPQRRPERKTAIALPDSDPPAMEIRGWDAEKTVFLEQVLFEIHIEDETGIQNLTINGKKVLPRPGRNVYVNYLAPLKKGENAFVIESTDPMGNVSRREIMVHRKVPSVYDLGARMSVALFPFDQKGAKKLEIEHILHGQLINSNRFDMRERQSAKFGGDSADEKAQEDAARKIAKDLGAEFALLGTVVAKESGVQISTRVVEARDGLLLTYEDVYGEEMDEKMIQNLCQGLVVKLSDSLPIVEGKVIKVKGNEVIVNLGENHRIKKGMHSILFEEGEPLKDPDTGEILGADVMELGTARVERIAQKLSYVKLMEEPPSELRAGIKLVTK